MELGVGRWSKREKREEGKRRKGIRFCAKRRRGVQMSPGT